MHSFPLPSILICVGLRAEAGTLQLSFSISGTKAYANIPFCARPMQLLWLEAERVESAIAGKELRLFDSY
jgi:hypothetical protein